MVSRRSFVASTAGAAGAVLGARNANAQELVSVSPPISQVTSEFLYFEDPVE